MTTCQLRKHQSWLRRGDTKAGRHRPVEPASGEESLTSQDLGL